MLSSRWVHVAYGLTVVLPSVAFQRELSSLVLMDLPSLHLLRALPLVDVLPRGRQGRGGLFCFASRCRSVPARVPVCLP